MVSNQWITAVALVGFTMFLQGEAITCWSCGTASEKECGDPKESGKWTELTDCQYCMTIKSHNSSQILNRNCYSSDTVAAKGLTEKDLVCMQCEDCTEITCLCATDKCNNGPTTDTTLPNEYSRATMLPSSLAVMVLSLILCKLFE